MAIEINSEIISSMEKTLDYATKKADQAEVILAKSDSFSLSADQGKIDKYQISNSRSIGVRVIKDSKVGISYTESLDSSSIQDMVDLALDNASHMKEDHFQKIESPIGDKKLINDHKKNYAEDSTETSDKIKFCIQLEKKVKELDPRIKGAPYNGYGESSVERYILNTEGLNSFERSRHFSCYTSCLIEEGNKNGMHYKGMSARTFKDLDAESVISESYAIAKGLLEASSLSSGKYNILFSTDCLQDFLSCFSIIFSGKSTVEGKNPFKDKSGEGVFSPLISIRDLPHFDDASHFHLFDDEGLLMKDLSLIENGVLSNFYHNSATAKEMGVKNNARASRGTKGQLSVGGTTKVIGVGTTPDKELTSTPYLEILSMQGLHSGANAISGDFSFAVSGHAHENGKVKPFKGVTLSGNFYQMMKDQVSELGDQLHRDSHYSFFTPLIRFNDMSISGS